MKVTVLQLASSNDPHANLLALRARLGPVLAGRPDLVVLPEASQRAFGHGAADLAVGAEPLDGPFVNGLIDMAEGSTLVAGMFELPKDGRLPFNTTVVVNGDGLQAVYRKIHLYDALGFKESEGIASGDIGEDNLVVIEVAGAKVGVLTCFDLRFPELASALVSRGAEVLALGAAWVPGPRKAQQFEALLAARAIETVSYVVAASQPAPRYCGRSQIVGPDGACIIRLSAVVSDERTVTLDVSAIEELRRTMPTGASRRLGSSR